MELGTGDLAHVFGITPRQVQALGTQGVLTKSAHGTWPLEVNVPAWVAYKVQSEVSRVSRTPADERLQKAKADALELRIERESRALIEEARAEALAVIDTYAGGLRSDIDAIPAQVTNDLELRRRLRELHDAAFAAAAGRADAEAARGGAAGPGSLAGPPSGNAPPPNRRARRAAARRAG